MIHVVIGTKAQLIKMGPVMDLLNQNKIEYNFIFTGQHQETMSELLDNFSLKKPDITLYKGKDITGIFQMFIWIIKICFKVLFNKKKIFGKTSKNDLLLTHGDTFSTLLGALMGKLARIKVAHVESGLRSFNLFHPFPEELTRILTFNFSDYYFCPGDWAKNNLKKYKGKKINTKANTLYDALKIAIKQPIKDRIKLPKDKFCLCSIHRFENIFKKDKFKSILDTLKDISKTIKILFILHPPTKQQLKKYDFTADLKKYNIELRPRYDYFDFIQLLKHSEFLITDGGSNQEEAYYLGKPCLLMRKTTEREEGLDKNVIISNYQDHKIQNFIKNYKNYQLDFLKQESPSKIIIDFINTQK